jgi:hypothetical protein
MRFEDIGVDMAVLRGVPAVRAGRGPPAGGQGHGPVAGQLPGDLRAPAELSLQHGRGRHVRAAPDRV